MGEYSSCWFFLALYDEVYIEKWIEIEINREEKSIRFGDDIELLSLFACV